MRVKSVNCWVLLKNTVKMKKNDLNNQKGKIKARNERRCFTIQTRH